MKCLLHNSKLIHAPLPSIPQKTLLRYNTFVHPSVSKTPGANYERLEFLGDSFCEFLFTEKLTSSFPNSDFQLLRGQLLSGKMMSKYTKIYGLDKELMHKGTQLPCSPKNKADLFEAYFGVFASTVYSSKTNDFNRKKKIQLIEEVDMWTRATIFNTIIGSKKKFGLSTAFDSNFFFNNSIQRQLEGSNNVKRNHISTGKSFARFVLTLVLFEKFPQMTEHKLTLLRDSFYLDKTMHHLIKGIQQQMKFKLEHENSIRLTYLSLGKYMSDAKSANEFLKKFSCVKVLVDELFTKALLSNSKLIQQELKNSTL